MRTRARNAHWPISAASLLGAALSLTSCRPGSSSAIAEARADEATAPRANDGRTALVELFTSEGCSSCPPADALLASLAAEPHVIALSFHVDYWDELGWPDPYASPDNTARQRAYATSFGTRSLYTPQLVVGGIDGFNGTDRDQAEADIAASLRKPSPVSLGIHARADGPRWITVDVDAAGVPPGSVLTAVLVQASSTSQVTAGENSGRTLRHVDVVRAMATRTASSSTPLRLRVPQGLRPGEADVVAFVQAAGDHAHGMPILAASRAAIAP